MGDTTSLGFGHFLTHADMVATVLLVVLAIMSATSWYLIVMKGISQVMRQRRSARFLNFFWSATSLETVQNELNTHGVHEPFGHLTLHSLRAQAHHEVRRRQARRAGSEQEYSAHHQEGARRGDDVAGERHTCWPPSAPPRRSSYSARCGASITLVAIGMSGSGMLDKVAGPVGEALIMTGIGLAVALPAVMGYNWLTRSNRVLTAKLDAFAFELLTFLTMGRSLQATQGQGRNLRPSTVALSTVPKS
jgi:biopolymer transport protein ExbB